MSLCHILLLFPGLFVTVRGVETPVCCPQAGDLQGQYGGGEAKARAQFLENCWFSVSPSNPVPWGLRLGVGLTGCRQLGAMLLYLEDVQPAFTEAKASQAP